MPTGWWRSRRQPLEQASNEGSWKSSLKRTRTERTKLNTIKMSLSSISLSMLFLSVLFASAAAQSNYASQANNVEYQGDGLPEQTVLDGKVTKLDDLSPVIFLNRTKAALNCAAGSMQVELKFNDKFYGIAYADFDRNSACHVGGKGALSYKLELPLKGCGTRQEPLRVFTNNIVVRFHPGLEMDGDEVITVVCRYPPPVTPLPPALPAPILEEIAPPVPIEPPLKGIQILLIICAILFLTLLLLGLGVSYLCLRRRTLPPHYRLPYSREGSEITKLSGSSLGNISAFEGVKIPRAHAPLQQAVSSSSGSEGIPPASDTLPSDYPSESHSEAEADMEIRSLPLSSYIKDVSDSAHSEGFGDSSEMHLANATAMSAARLPLAVKQPAPPAFDVQVRVRRAPPSPPDRMSDDTSIRSDRNLSTIEEQREEIPPPPAPPGPPRRVAQAPPLYSRIVRKNAQEWDAAEMVETRRPRSIASLNTEMTDTHSITELVDDSHSKMFSVKRPAPPPPVQIVREEMQMESLEHMPETPILPARKPEITAHMVDDVFLRTITEKKTIEDIERHRRLVTEYRAARAAAVPPARWDVTIRNYPADQGDGRWENFSDVSSASGMTIASRSEPPLMPQNYIGSTGPHLFSPELVGNIGGQGLPLLPELPPARNPIYTEEETVPHNWDVLVRVLQPEANAEVITSDTLEEHETLTMEERNRWREIITSRCELRSELSSCSRREDFRRISEDERYSALFPQHKWEVILRILAPPSDKPKGGRYRKKSDWDTRSRRSSLPTLYEYDSEGGTSGRTPRPPQASSPSRRTSRSSYRSDHVDMRSMSEMMVDYARMDNMDSQSEASMGMPLSARFYDTDSDNEQDFRMPRTSSQRSLQRSLSQPSLVRSASEFTERWAAHEQDDDGDASDDEDTPRAVRRHLPQQAEHQHMATFTSSEVRTFQATKGWPRQ